MDKDLTDSPTEQPSIVLHTNESITLVIHLALFKNQSSSQIASCSKIFMTRLTETESNKSI